MEGRKDGEMDDPAALTVQNRSGSEAADGSEQQKTFPPPWKKNVQVSSA